MRFLRKISPSPYADSIHYVIAYSGEDEQDQKEEPEHTLRLPMTTVEVDTTRTPIAQQMAFERSLEIHQCNQAVQEEHKDATNIVGVAALAGTIGGSPGGPATAALGAVTAGGAAAYAGCYVACHDQSPPKLPSACNDGG